MATPPPPHCETALVVSLAKCNIYPHPDGLVSDSDVQNFIKGREEFFEKRPYLEVTINDKTKACGRQYYQWHRMILGKDKSNNVLGAFFDGLVHLLNKFQGLLPECNVALFFENKGPLYETLIFAVKYKEGFGHEASFFKSEQVYDAGQKVLDLASRFMNFYFQKDRSLTCFNTWGIPRGYNDGTTLCEKDCNGFVCRYYYS